PFREMLTNVQYLALIAANILAMTVYSLWTTWTTYFLVTHFRLSQAEANLKFAWIPPIFATLGGLFGGWLALTLIRRGTPVIPARLRIATWGAVFVLVTAAAPLLPRPGLAVATIC